MTFPLHDFRVLVTGSRMLKNSLLVGDALSDIYNHEIHAAPGWRLVVVHGDCPTGADAFARYWATVMEHKGYSVTQERHPADWEGPCHEGFCKPGHRRMSRGREICPAAGNWRNEQMTRTRLDRGLAFFKYAAENVGTTDCYDRATRRRVLMKRVDGY